MKKLIIHFLLFTLFTFSSNYGQTPAFPGAEGFGRFTSGGRGGKVIFVTNLNDSGPGSLREAIKDKEPRIITFTVSGTISLKSEITIKHGNLTIAGQTAPGDGICLKDDRLLLEADNIIIRFLRFRLGDKTKLETDAVSGIGNKDIIIDHCSMSWGIDENASFYDNENFTLQWSIISEALNNSYHHKGEHGYGGIWGGVNVSFHHNLLAHNSSRNPRFNGARTGTTFETELVDFQNNVIYNWGSNSAYGGEKGKYNIVGNFYKAGASSHNKKRIVEPSDGNGKWFVNKNYVEAFPAITQDNWSGGVQGDFAHEQFIHAEVPFKVAEVLYDEPLIAYKKILMNAGAVLPKRDEVDARVVLEVCTGTAHNATGIIDSQDEVGGWPLLNCIPSPADSDIDGMPDDWEKENNLNPSDASDNCLLDSNGYTNLERYLNSLAAKVFK